jgi:hypothetical protein
MTGHDADNPVTAHIRIGVRSEDEVARLRAAVSEIVAYDRAAPGEPPRAIDALVTADQLAALERAGVAFEHVARVWSQEEVKRQVSQGNRYAERLRELRKPGPRD